MKSSIVLIFTAGIGLMLGPHPLAQTTPYPPGGGANQSTQSRQSRSNSQKSQPANTAPTKIAPSKAQATMTEARTSQSKSHQLSKEHGHGYSHGGGGVGIGVGATIDLSGIGQRRAEADPFAVPAASQPVTARTEEKLPRAKKPKETANANPFAGVQLTGEQAKEKSNPQ